MSFQLTYKPYRERSILIEWQAKISTDILYDILAFKDKIQSDFTKNIQSLNHAYHSLLITYKNDDIDFQNEISDLKKLYNLVETKKETEKTLWKIPVCYDDSFGVDLDIISKEKKLSKQDIIEKHTNADYTVYFIGFLPGFLYLGGLDEALHFPRKATPNLKILKGSVAIGGNQTGIYPNESPGGWHVIGNSPINFFDVKKENPCFAKAGDVIRFYQVPLSKYNDIKTLVDARVYQMESEVIID